MSGKVVRMADCTGNNTHVSPERLLEETLELVREGEIKSKRLVVLFLDTEDDAYDVRIRMAGGVRWSEIVSLVEVVKKIALSAMGF